MSELERGERKSELTFDIGQRLLGIRDAQGIRGTTVICIGRVLKAFRHQM